MQHEINIPEEAFDDYKAIFERGEYDVPLSTPPELVLDIGGNVGLYSLKAVQLYPNAKVKAYEPWPVNAASFRRNTESFANIELEESGVRLIGDQGQEMHHGRNRMCCSFLASDGPAETVRTIAASELPAADVIKIDTEGCELEILQGINLSRAQAVMCEAHSADDRVAILSLMSKRGFHVYADRPTLNGCSLLKFTREKHVEPKLFAAIPIYGQVPFGFVNSLRNLESRPPCNLHVSTRIGDSLVSRARNGLAADFLESDCTHLLFIDSDLVFSPDHVKRLLDHNKDIVAGFYPAKAEGPIKWIANACFEPEPVQPDGLQKMRYMGTGFLMIKRCVFERIIEIHGEELWYKPDESPREREHDLFRVGPYHYPDGARRYLSEDWFFCQMALDAGFEVFGDTKVILKHIGQAVYPLKSQEAEMVAKAQEVAA